MESLSSGEEDEEIKEGGSKENLLNMGANRKRIIDNQMVKQPLDQTHLLVNQISSTLI